MNGLRKQHNISLTESQEKDLEQVRKATGFSIVKILMATVNALKQTETETVKIMGNVEVLTEEE